MVPILRTKSRVGEVVKQAPEASRLGELCRPWLDWWCAQASSPDKDDPLTWRLAPLDFGPELRWYDDEPPNNKVLDAVEAWRREGGRFMVVAGGTTATVARCAQWRDKVACRFLCRSDDQRRNATMLVRCMAFQLAQDFPRYRQELEKAAEDTFEALLLEPLARVSVVCKGRMLIVIDAIDEALDVLQLVASSFHKLPSWLAVVATAKPTLDAKAWFGSRCSVIVEPASPRKDLEEKFTDEDLRVLEVVAAGPEPPLLTELRALCGVKSAKAIARRLDCLSMEDGRVSPRRKVTLKIDAVHRRLARLSCRILLPMLDASCESDAHASRAARREFPDLLEVCLDEDAHDYALRHAVFHVLKAGLPELALAVMSAFGYLRARAETGRIDELVVDAASVPGAALLHDALRLSSSHLSRDPASLAEQLWQRCMAPASRRGPIEVEQLARDARRLARATQALSGRAASLAPAGAPLRCVLDGHRAAIRAVVAFELLGTVRLATCSDDTTVRVSDPETGATLVVLDGHTRPVRNVVAFVAVDGAPRLASIDDKSLRIWEPLDGSQIAVFEDATLTGCLAAFGVEDGSRLATGSGNKIRVWNCSDGVRAELDGHTDKVLCVVAFKTDAGAPRLASCGRERTIRVWDPVEGTVTFLLKGHTRSVAKVVDCGGGVLASCSDDKTVRVWNSSDGSQVCVLAGHEGPVSDVAAFVADGETRLATLGAERALRIWDPSAQRCLAVEYKDGKGLVAFDSRAGARLAIFDGLSVRIWDASAVGDGSSNVGLHAHKYFVLGATAFYDGSQRLATCSADKSIKIWDPVACGPPLKILHGHSRPIRCVVAFEADAGPRIASGSDDRTVRIWDPTGGSAVAVLQAPGAVTALVAFGNERMLAGGSDDRTVRLWSASAPNETLAVLEGHKGAVYGVASLVGGELASCSLDRTVRVWDPLKPRAELRVLEGHESAVHGIVSFVDGGPRLATCSSDKTVRIWDPLARFGNTLRVFQHPDWVRALAIVPTTAGPRVASCCDDNTIAVWNPASSSSSSDSSISSLPLDNAAWTLATLASSAAGTTSDSRLADLEVEEDSPRSTCIVVLGHANGTISTFDALL